MNIFQLKNGKRFMTALMNCDDKKPEICVMFVDNVKNHPLQICIEYPFADYLKMGWFKDLVGNAFDWDATPEGGTFWCEIYNTIRDCDMTKPRKEYPDYRKKDRFCIVCDEKIRGWKYCPVHAAEVLAKTNKHRSAKKAVEIVREEYEAANSILF